MRREKENTASSKSMTVLPGSVRTTPFPWLDKESKPCLPALEVFLYWQSNISYERCTKTLMGRNKHLPDAAGGKSSGTVNSTDNHKRQGSEVNIMWQIKEHISLLSTGSAILRLVLRKSQIRLTWLYSSKKSNSIFKLLPTLNGVIITSEASSFGGFYDTWKELVDLGEAYSFFGVCIGNHGKYIFSPTIFIRVHATCSTSEKDSKGYDAWRKLCICLGSACTMDDLGQCFPKSLASGPT